MVTTLTMEELFMKKVCLLLALSLVLVLGCKKPVENPSLACEIIKPTINVTSYLLAPKLKCDATALAGVIMKIPEVLTICKAPTKGVLDEVICPLVIDFAITAGRDVLVNEAKCDATLVDQLIKDNDPKKICKKQ